MHFVSLRVPSNDIRADKLNDQVTKSIKPKQSLLRESAVRMYIDRQGKYQKPARTTKLTQSRCMVQQYPGSCETGVFPLKQLLCEKYRCYPSPFFPLLLGIYVYVCVLHLDTIIISERHK